ncbi:MAG: hypothetical protein IKQ55_13345 [Kiritimatiellae bacterium]|nr:hypothetical protein [Kiritimatiellia bacterium]
MEDAFAQKDKKETKGRLECGKKANIEKHENRFADMESGRKADGQSGRGRPAREASEKRKTSENASVFCNLTSSAAPRSRPAEIPAPLVRKLPRHFRGCGILPRRRKMRGRQAAPHLVTFHFSLVTAPEGRRGILPRQSG